MALLLLLSESETFNVSTNTPNHNAASTSSASPQGGYFQADPAARQRETRGCIEAGRLWFGGEVLPVVAAVTAHSASASTSVNGSGVLGGFQTGYNKQFGTYVLGFETDLDLTSIKNTTAGVDTKLTWFGTTRTRAGFLINPSLLFYGTGGVAYGRVEESVPGASIKTPGVGWAAGAGLQYALTPQWSIGAEYLHLDLDLGNANAGGVSVDAKARTNLGRATLNYKF